MSIKNNFTIKYLESIDPPPSGKRTYVMDSKVSGLGLAVTSTGVKSFFVYRKINGVPKRITLGRFPDLTIELARSMALGHIRKIAQGIDPIAEKKEKRAKAITLSEAFEAYLKARKSLKPLTIKDYKRIMFEVFPDWQNKPLREITKDMVAKRHTEFGVKSEARANNAMRVLRAIFNFAMGEYEDANGQSLFLENPVKRLSHTRSWFKIKARKSIIKMHELKAWFNAVITLPDDTAVCKSGTTRDYLLTLLFTGLRRQECATLVWEQIDLVGKTLTIEDTKNHQQHLLPLPDFIFNILSIRHANRSSKYVFPGEGKHGFIGDPRTQMDKVIAESGVKFTLHDLRRTFITIAEGLDLSPYALKKLLNHKQTGDVTAGYIIINVDRLRDPMAKIEQHILALTEIHNKEEVHI